MARRLFVGAFSQFSMSHHYAGTWRLPEASGNRGYADVETWVELARLAESATIDVLMFADALGQGGYFDGDLDTPVREGIFPRMDPSVLVAALARETRELGFVLTSAMVQDHPFHFARRMSTLDHLTGGGVGWNIVTSYSPGMWLNLGLDPNLDHTERYEWADEYMDVLYKLWEGSWERDAPVHSVERNVWADPAKVHTIDHESRRYRVRGPMTFAVGETEREAKAKYQRYVDALSVTGLAAKLNNQIGFDVATLGPNVPVEQLATNGIQSVVDTVRTLFPAGARPTVAEFLVANSVKGLVAGTPAQIADRLEELAEVGVDGLLLNLMTRPGTLSDFVEMVVPELRRRGLMQTEYAPGTFRQKLFGAGDLLPDHHPGAGYRRVPAG